MDVASDFESPVQSVAGAPVRLTHLVELAALPPGETDTLPVMSSYLRGIMVAAAQSLDNTGKDDDHSGLRLGDILQTMLLQRGNRPFTGFGPFYDAMKGPAVPPIPKIKSINIRAKIDPTTIDRVIVGGDVTAVLAKAAQLAAELRDGRRGVIGLRHFTLAVLLTLEGREALWWDSLVEGAPEGVLPDLAGGLEACLEPQSFFTDDREGWHRYLVQAGEPDPEPRLPRPLQVSEDSYVPDQPVGRLEHDRLGFAEEVRALARVVTLKEPGPPLAVGLFGDWGSGKSSFMNMLEDAIEQTAEQARENEAAGQLFVSNVVHIRFNAWVYNDTDLWSSLTSECFRQLRRGGSKGSQQTALKNVLDELSEFVAGATTEASSAATELEDKRKTRDRLKQELERKEQTREATRAQSLSAAAQATIDEFGSGRVKAALGAVGSDLAAIKDDSTGEKAAAALKQEIDQTAGLAGQLTVIAMTLLRSLNFGTKTSWYIWIPFLFGLAVLFMLDLEAAADWLADGVVRVAAVLASVVAAAGPLAVAYRTAEPLFRAGKRFRTSYAEAEADAEQQLAEAKKALEEAEVEVAALTEKRDRAEAEAERFREAQPSDVLEFFLQESDDTRSFDANLGVVSKVREVFEKLDAIIQEGRREQGTAPIDRIVLYIDDLDRCRAETVVNVLEAVHLLLALNLFVVVVGVDQRWLSRALEEKLHLKASNPGTGGTATPKDYLEKIFQIPIRLGRLETASEAFGGYVESISGPRAQPERAREARQDADDQSGQGPRLTIEAADVALPPLEREAEESAEAVLLREHELALTKALGPMMGRSPRAVKKFVNLYRLLRGMRRGSALERFLGPPQEVAEEGVGNYAAVQFWLAADCGLSSSQMRALRNAVRNTHTKASLIEVFARPLPEPRNSGSDKEAAAVAARVKADKEARPEMYAFWAEVADAQVDDLWNAFEAIDEALPDPFAVHALRASMTETQRFSASL